MEEGDKLGPVNRPVGDGRTTGFAFERKGLT
jgi:hypothetical protein